MTYPVIGSKYDGVPLDRPCLRRLPANWHLDTDAEPRPYYWDIALAWFAIGLGVGVILILLSVLR